MISVIVPVYKVEKYLNKCVESIVNQTYKDLEIILVDDGSPDNCPAMCDEWAKKDERIKVIHKENGGLSSARNVGLDVAVGEYISFVDSDDTIDLNMCEVMISEMKKTDTDIVICGHQCIAESKLPHNCNISEYCLEFLDYEQLWREIFGRLNNASWNKIYKRSIVNELRFPDGIIHGEDLLFNLEYLIRIKSGVKVDLKLYHYYKRQGSITNSSFNKKKFFEIEAKDRALEFVNEYKPNQINTAKKFCFRARMNVIRSIYSSKQQKKYSYEIKVYNSYLKENFGDLKKSLRMKEIVEFYLYFYLKPAYILFTYIR